MKFKFQWTDRNACVAELAKFCLEREVKFDQAIKGVLLHDYCTNISSMTQKHMAALKKDVMKRVKDTKLELKAPEIGDIVLVAKLIANPLLGGYRQDGKELVEAVVVNMRRMSSWIHYKVRRIQDGEIQEGNGHMIKSIVRRVSEAHSAV
ncbi:hypothetical protein HZF08_33500 [Paenibacillus sp. CGMCC 1.16610]|uniref:HD domain-containing protein n=1 Tax=Paenibacillus anseongense TaxID=2682845 RepID=A0ABW9U5T8_9BACL|nr:MULTISPECIES: hypothetical protein [Paenibacillus]MBA2943188.1 hypothetical protein [Paenibacillus sp. CGMCC 1.16610]MVQ33685.1 hypothetical protein [Paenibacillus anseongense]